MIKEMNRHCFVICELLEQQLKESVISVYISIPDYTDLVARNRIKFCPAGFRIFQFFADFTLTFEWVRLTYFYQILKILTKIDFFQNGIRKQCCFFTNFQILLILSHIRTKLDSDFRMKFLNLGPKCIPGFEMS